jgi:hypothetical protein
MNDDGREVQDERRSLEPQTLLEKLMMGIP